MGSSTLSLVGSLVLLMGSASADLLMHKDVAAEGIISQADGNSTTGEKGGIQVATFEQIIDHKHPELGTFSQRYFWNADYYKGPGSPVLVYAGGENNAEAYKAFLTNTSLTGAMMESNGAAGILLEHRYWGKSSPHDSLTVENLQQLTVENALHDINNFANNVRLPFDEDRTSTPDKAPWILSGCSYAGSLAGWTSSMLPGTFWAYYASSAGVQAIGDMWQYYTIIEEAMPRNCSKDVQAVVKYMDGILTGDDEQAIVSLKKRFGLEEVVYNDDFADDIRGGITAWQQTNAATGYGKFHQFCDYIENQWPESNSTKPGPEGVGLEKAMDGWTKWSHDILLPGMCSGSPYWDEDDLKTCTGSHDPDKPSYSDLSVDNDADRQWWWFLCNEPFKYWQTHHNGGSVNILSKLVQVSYWERRCEMYFPSRGSNVTYGINKGRTTDDFNRFTGGWDKVDAERVLWVNGEFDPWRATTVSSHDRPGGPLQSSDKVAVRVVPGGSHCADLQIKNAEANPEIRKLFDEEVSIMKKWVDEFYETKGKRPSSG